MHMCVFGAARRLRVSSWRMAKNTNASIVQRFTQSHQHFTPLNSRFKPSLSCLMVNAKSLRSGSCFAPTPKPPHPWDTQFRSLHPIPTQQRVMLASCYQTQHQCSVKTQPGRFERAFLLLGRHATINLYMQSEEIIRLGGGLHPDVVIIDSR